MTRLILVIACFFAAALSASEPRPLRVGVSIDFEPIAFLVSDELQGIEVDFARILAGRIDRPLELKMYPFRELLDALEKREIDIIMSAMSITEERKQRVRFSDAYMNIGQMAIVRTEDASRFGQPSALLTHGLRVGVHRGTTGEAYVEENLPHANTIAFDSVEIGLESLRKGELDVFIHDSTTSWQLSRSFVNDNLMSLNRFLTSESIGWAVHKDDPEFQTTINLILKDMKEQGQVAEVIGRWLPVIPVTL